MRYLLQSDALERLSENDLYYFLGAWISEQAPFSDGRLKTLVKKVRVSEIDVHYSANVIAFCPYLSEVGGGTGPLARF